MVLENTAIGIALVDGDIQFINGQLRTVKGIDFTAQNIDERLATRHKELFLDQSVGIDRYKLIHSNNHDYIANTIKKVITNTPTVDKIISFNLNQIDREIQIEHKTSTIFGDELKRTVTL